MAGYWNASQSTSCWQFPDTRGSLLRLNDHGWLRSSRPLIYQICLCLHSLFLIRIQICICLTDAGVPFFHSFCLSGTLRGAYQAGVMKETEELTVNNTRTFLQGFIMELPVRTLLTCAQTSQPPGTVVVACGCLWDCFLVFNKCRLLGEKEQLAFCGYGQPEQQRYSCRFGR
jgi:hypothetical protein